MGNHVAGRTLFSGALIGGLALGLSVVEVGQAATAGATCASFFGIGNSADCTSTLTSIAVAIGAGATATAHGAFGAALAFGANSGAWTSGGGLFKGGGVLNLATVVGQGSWAQTAGLLGVAFAGGDNVLVNSGLGSSPITGTVQIANLAIELRPQRGPLSATESEGIGNLSILVGDGTSQARGIGNSAVSVGGPNLGTYAFGYFNTATALAGHDNQVAAYSPDPPNTAITSTAFSLGGDGNAVTAADGPLALAGSIGQTGATVTQTGPGVNINNTIVASAAAVPAAQRGPSATASFRGTRPSPAASVDAGVGAKRPSPATASRRS